VFRSTRASMRVIQMFNSRFSQFGTHSQHVQIIASGLLAAREGSTANRSLISASASTRNLEKARLEKRKLSMRIPCDSLFAHSFVGVKNSTETRCVSFS